MGYGGMGGWHTKRSQEIPVVVGLAGVYDISRSATRLLRKTGIHGSSLRSCLADKTVDVVTVAIPNDQHKKVCIRVMRSGQGCHQ